MDVSILVWIQHAVFAGGVVDSAVVGSPEGGRADTERFEDWHTVPPLLVPRRTALPPFQ